MFEYTKSILFKPKCGFYFTDKYIQALELGWHLKKIKVKGFNQIQLSEGLIENGKILKPELLAEEIKRLFDEAKPNPIKLKKCIVSVPPSQNFEYVFYLPVDLKGEEFIEQLEKNIKETIPLPFEDINYKYSVSIYGKVQVVFVVAVNKDVIASYRVFLNELCRINSVEFESEYLSLLRNVSWDFDKNSVSVFIYDDGYRLFWFSLWHSYIFDSNSIWITDIEKSADFLANDIKKSASLFELKTKKKISKVCFLGRKDRFTILDGIFRTSLNLPVTLLDESVVSVDSQGINSLYGYRIIEGLALRGIGIDDKMQTKLLFDFNN